MESLQDEIEDALLQEFDGRATLGELQAYLEDYSLSQLYSFFNPDTELCHLFYNTQEYASIAVVFERDAKFCVHYNSRNFCRENNCQYFHLCRGYIDYKSCNARRCNLSHDIGDSHNLAVTRRLGLGQYNCKERLILVRNSNPKVCLNYNSPRGCENSQPGSCPDIHICSDEILNKCSRGPERCRYNHDIYECSETLSVYISMRNSEEFLKRVITVPKRRDGSGSHVSQDWDVATQRTESSQNGIPIYFEIESAENNMFDPSVKEHWGMTTEMVCGAQNSKPLPNHAHA